MLNRIIKFLAVALLLITVVFCTRNSKNNNNEQAIKTDELDVEEEIDRWKLELLNQNHIGSPCAYTEFSPTAVRQWREKNPDQLDGLPLEDKAINSIPGDFNNDNQEDLLLYFQAENCTGHNGGTATFAKLIYADGTTKSDLMDEIRNAIQSEYQQSSKENESLEKVTDAYLSSTTTVNGYRNGVTGDFKLYTETDAHCCPSYSGNYVYGLKNEKMRIEIREN